MTLSHVSKLYGVFDAKVDKMLTDPAGGPATYGTARDVPGIKEIDLGMPFEVKRLRGDNGPMDSMSVLGDPTGSMSYAKQDLEILALALGAVLVDAGSTPTQKATLSIKTGQTPGLFRIRGQAAGTDLGIGAVTFVIFKAQLSDSVNLGLAEEDFKTVQLPFSINPTATGQLVDIEYAEAAVALT